MVNQFELYANLSKGRNFFWRIFFEDTLKPEFLSSAIWDSNYQKLRTPLFGLLINLYIDKEPLTEVQFPQLLQVIDPSASRKNYKLNRILRGKVQDKNLNKAMFKPLIKNLNKKLKKERKKIVKKVKDLVKNQDLGPNEISKDLEYCIGIFKLVDLLMKLNVYDIFDAQDSLNVLVKSSMSLLEYSNNFMYMIPLLKYLRKRNYDGSK